MTEEKTTALKWKFKTGHYIYRQVAISEGVICFGSCDNHFYAVDIETGKEKWRFETGGYVCSSPLISEGVIYFGSDDKHLYALDAKTGAKKWKFETENSVRSSPLVSEGVIYFSSDHKYFCALDAKTGKEKWRFNTNAPSSSGSPCIALSEGMVFFGSCDNHLYAVDAKIGVEKWKFETGDGIYFSPVASDSAVYFGSDDNHLYAVDVKTGEEKWKFNTGNRITSPKLSDGVVYFSSGYHLYALDNKIGKEKWKFEAEGTVESSPTVLDGVVYFRSRGKHLYAVDIKTGKEKWKFDSEKEWRPSPTVLDGVTYLPVGTELQAIDNELALLLASAKRTEEEKIRKLKEQEEQNTARKLKEFEDEKKSNWNSEKENNLKKIRELMVSSQFAAGIELAQTIDDPYLLLELVEGCEIGEDGTITLNETFATNAVGENYDKLAGALLKMILTINDIQKPESSLILENIKMLNLCSFVKLPENIDSFTNLKTIVIALKHSKSIPKEYSSIKDLQIKTALSAEEIVQAIWDNGPADAIYNYSYETEVTHAEADYIENEGLGCERLEEVDPDAKDYDPEETEKIKIDVESYIDDNFEGDFFDKVNADTLIEESGSYMVSKEDIESTISSMLYDLCYFFNDFIVVPGSEENPWENEDTIYLGNIPTPEVCLKDLNPDWTADEYYLVD
jgi:outer membrane protein assembly factor BamB